MTFNTGEVKPCCDTAPMGENQGQSLLEIWNGETWRELRRSFILNEKHKACQSCWNREDRGYLSVRETSIPREQALAHCDQSGAMQLRPREISLRLGNKCNLACVMCSPANSSLWLKDQSIYEHHVGHEVGPLVEELNIESEEFSDILRDIEIITFIGGEPILFQQHEKILKSLINSGRAPFIELHYFTNTTIMPNWCLEVWKQFKKIKLRSSIDGVGSLYEYIRYPAKWPLIEKNILKLTNAGLNNLEYSFSFVLMNLNVLSLELFFRWRNDFFKGTIAPIIRPDYLIEPIFLRAHYLPDPIKKEAILSLQRTIDLGSNDEKKLISDMLEQVQTEDPRKNEMLSRLKRYLTDLDKSRGLDHSKVLSWIE